MEKQKSIVISGTPASGKSTIIKVLEKELNMPSHLVGEMLRAEWRRAYPEGIPSFEKFWRNMNMDFHRKLNEELKVVFESGGVIGDSRYVSYLDEKTCIKVFVTADIGTRRNRAMLREEYMGKSPSDVQEILESREAHELRIGMELFGADYRDPNIYHIMINSGILSVKEETSIIKNIVAEKTHA